MPDSRFHVRRGPFDLDELSDVAGARVVGDGPGCSLTDVAPLSTAGAGYVSFFDNRRYMAAFVASKASVCLVHPDVVAHAPAGMALLVCDNPYLGYARVCEAFYPPPPLVAGVSEDAVIDSGAELGSGCRIDAGAVIGPGARVGSGCWIGPHAVIGAGVELGAGCRIGAHASIAYAVVGKKVVVQTGARIGQPGFGFAHADGVHHAVPQLGRVMIGDGVNIGANTTIDRGSGPDTVIGAGCIIDNLVQIGHNVVLGRGCVIVAQCGISGSTRLGDHVVVGGQAGFTGHLRVGDGVQVAAQSGVMRDVAAGDVVAGSPSVPARAWHRQNVTLARLAKKSVTKKSETGKSPG